MPPLWLAIDTLFGRDYETNHRQSLRGAFDAQDFTGLLSIAHDIHRHRLLQLVWPEIPPEQRPNCLLNVWRNIELGGADARTRVRVMRVFLTMFRDVPELRRRAADLPARFRVYRGVRAPSLRAARIAMRHLSWSLRPEVAAFFSDRWCAVAGLHGFIGAAMVSRRQVLAVLDDGGSRDWHEAEAIVGPDVWGRALVRRATAEDVAVAAIRTGAAKKGDAPR